jgi:hypothetical protein
VLVPLERRAVCFLRLSAERFSCYRRLSDRYMLKAKHHLEGCTVSRHIEISKLTAFMLTQQKLTEEEEGHLIRCKECMNAMAEATFTDLKNESDPNEPPRVK